MFWFWTNAPSLPAAEIFSLRVDSGQKKTDWLLRT
jgi:hypothetical protein